MKRFVTLASARRPRGQSLAEFAIVMPLLLTFVGASIDFARVYIAWINLESATRDAAQWIASDPAHRTTGGYYDATDTANYCNNNYPCSSAPATDAKTVLDAQVGVSFGKTSEQSSCTTAKVWGQIPTAPSTSSTAGGSAAYPVATGKVTACLPFRTLFSYPLLTSNGAWILRTERTVVTIVGR